MCIVSRQAERFLPTDLQLGQAGLTRNASYEPK